MLAYCLKCKMNMESKKLRVEKTKNEENCFRQIVRFVVAKNGDL